MERFVLDLSNGIKVSPRLSAVAVSSKPGVVKNDMENGYICYSFSGIHLMGEEISISFCFLTSKLISLEIALSNKLKYGSSWDDFSEEKEQLRAEDTESWLRGSGIINKCDWGSFAFGYDPKSASGAAVVRIRYAI